MPPQQMDFEARRQDARRLAREIILAELGARPQRGPGGGQICCLQFEADLRDELSKMPPPAAQQNWNIPHGNPNDSVNGPLDSAVRWAIRSLHWLSRGQEYAQPSQDLAGPDARQRPMGPQAGPSAFEQYNRLSEADQKLVANAMQELLGDPNRGYPVQKHLPIAASIAHGNQWAMHYGSAPPPRRIQLPGDHTATHPQQDPARLRKPETVLTTSIGTALAPYARHLLPAGLSFDKPSSSAPGSALAPAGGMPLRPKPRMARG